MQLVSNALKLYNNNQWCLFF